MTSLTTWTRLEPRSQPPVASGLEARIHDPLWMLARQWQCGEFRGEDCGSPVNAVLRYQATELTRFYPGWPEDAAGQSYKAEELPLETLVEREAAPQAPDLRVSVEAALQFLRLLGADLAAKYRARFLDAYPLGAGLAREQLDTESAAYLDLMAPRVFNGAKLYQDSKARTPKVAIEAADRSGVEAATTTWMRWYEDLYASGVRNPWRPDRLEYSFAVTAPALVAPGASPPPETDRELLLAAEEYRGGRLDWYSFSVDMAKSPGGAKQPGQAEARIERFPTPVRFPGMPASRWWEFEDSRVSFGSVEADLGDLARLLLVEFALVYGNDFFVIPLELPIGSVCRINAVEVRDTFGEITQVPPASSADGAGAPWRMFCLSAGTNAGGDPPDLLFLPPVLGPSISSRPIEDVLFFHDEMANFAWGVERVVTSAAGAPLDRHTEWQRRRPEAPPPPQQDAPSAWVYRIESGVPPDHWIPMTPVNRATGDYRLRVTPLLRPDGSVAQPQGCLLQAGVEVREAEVPREGVRVIRTFEYARWTDGSTRLWVSRSKRPGAGEGSAGLRFDTVDTRRL